MEQQRERVRKEAPDKRQTNLLPLILVAAVILIAVLAVVLHGSGGGQDPVPQARLDEGLAFLSRLEEKDPAAVDEVLKQRRAEKLAAEREELLRQLYAGEIDVWSMFEDYVVLGDSRAVGFYYYGFLDKARTLADGGNTIRTVAEHLDEIEALNPSSVYLCYGLNDVSLGIEYGLWPTPESYSAEMLEVVRSIEDRVPGVTVVVSSILPARDPAFQRASAWYQIPTYSAAVEEMCKENGIIFVNNDETAAEHGDLYQPDGIHLQPKFYNYWGANMIIAVLEAQQTEEG